MWTWNAIGKRPVPGSWRPRRRKPTKGFLLNHLIDELLPAGGGGHALRQSDPVTGQAAWYDLRVRLEQAGRRPRIDRARFAAAAPPAGPAASRRDTALRRRVSGGEQAAMTCLPAQPSQRSLGLVIDLDTCVGCHACAVSCKEWNTGGYPGAAVRPRALRRQAPGGAWLNRIHSFEVRRMAAALAAPCISRAPACIARNAACVTVCPTGASYKRAEDGIVLVDESIASAAGCAPGPAPTARASSTLTPA